MKNTEKETTLNYLPEQIEIKDILDKISISDYNRLKAHFIKSEHRSFSYQLDSLVELYDKLNNKLNNK
ncbi:hypothetical protein EP331_00435 [bacterium]|nr:MAG: hypothetical protein EP331_00435 [bacterium]